MIYYYDILIEYTIGDKKILKDYTKCFNEICDFFIWLKNKHKDNFTIIEIKKHKIYGKKIGKVYYETFICEGDE